MPDKGTIALWEPVVGLLLNNEKSILCNIPWLIIILKVSLCCPIKKKVNKSLRLYVSVYTLLNRVRDWVSRNEKEVTQSFSSLFLHYNWETLRESVFYIHRSVYDGTLSHKISTFRERFWRSGSQDRRYNTVYTNMGTTENSTHSLYYHVLPNWQTFPKTVSTQTVSLFGEGPPHRFRDKPVDRNLRIPP